MIVCHKGRVQGDSVPSWIAMRLIRWSRAAPLSAPPGGLRTTSPPWDRDVAATPTGRGDTRQVAKSMMLAGAKAQS